VIVSIASGKGGTGKTTIATNMALSAGKCEFLDCDVEEPNAHIFIKPEMLESRPVDRPVPQVDFDKCTYCGKCGEVCQFSAIVVIRQSVVTFPELCHGCGACSGLCPENAITEVGKRLGLLEIGESNGIRFIHGILEVSEAMSPPLIRAVKKEANGGLVIRDAPPGTSCPTIEAVNGSDFCILVTEPTPFGLNDLKLAVGMLRTLKIPFGVIVNRSDIGDNAVFDYCRHEEIPILMRVLMDRDLAVAYSNGIPLVEMRPEWKGRFVKLLDDISRMI